MQQVLLNQMLYVHTRYAFRRLDTLSFRVWGGAVGFGTDSNAAMLLASVAGRPTAETEAITTEKVFHN